MGIIPLRKCVNGNERREEAERKSPRALGFAGSDGFLWMVALAEDDALRILSLS